MREVPPHPSGAGGVPYRTTRPGFVARKQWSEPMGSMSWWMGRNVVRCLQVGERAAITPARQRPHFGPRFTEDGWILHATLPQT